MKATQLEPDVIDWTPFRAGQMVRFAAVCPSCQGDVCTVIVKTWWREHQEAGNTRESGSATNQTPVESFSFHLPLK